MTTGKRVAPFVLVILALLLYACQSSFTDVPERTPVQFNSEQISNTPYVSVHVSDIIDTGYMKLVNRTHAVPGEPNAALLQPAWPTVPVSRVDIYLHRSALAAIEAMFASARAAGVGPFHVTSGFRDVERQRALYGNGANSAFVQPPGYSEHHTGLAADIMADGLSMSELADSPQGQWLAANAYRYGLILRYPNGAQAITGIEFEPWHFRYVGPVHAYFMRRNNLVLEEYIELLQQEGGVSFVMNSVAVQLLYLRPENGIIYVPAGLDHITVSSSNAGGYIVKAW